MNMRKWLAPLTLLTVAAQPLLAQDRQGFFLSATVQGYSFSQDFADEVGVKSASLVIVPLAYQLAASRTLSFDVYSAFARGDVKTGTETHTLQGFVDTRVRATLSVAPWASVTAALNLPTGKASHDQNEGVVAAALSTELLGFREALWGTGFGATTGIATAWKAGPSTGIGFGASYRLASEFEPSADTAFKYTPGNEVRLRFALDQNIGTSKLTLGATFQNYSDDQIDGRNLFAPGNRWRGDLAYSFRAGPTSTWTLFATDVWRENGDVSLQVVDPAGNPLRDSTFTAGQQNMAVAGIAGGLRLANGFDLRPSADVRLLTRNSGDSEGWMASIGTEVPMRRGSIDWVPSCRFSYGGLEGSTDTRHGFIGGEVGLTVRF